MNVSQYLTRMRTILNDSGQSRFSDPLLEAALRITLNAYSMASPNQDDHLFTVETSGREQVLSALVALRYMTIIEIHHPYNAAAYTQSLVTQWYFFQSGIHPALYFTGSVIPRAGEKILIRYAAAQTIADLDSAGVTTIRSDYEEDLAMGAAGQALLLRAASLPEAYGSRTAELHQMQTLGNSLLNNFTCRLSALRAAVVRSQGPHPGVSWKLDGWDHA